ncbi:MAG: Maf family protein [Thermoleophilia bacterium]
MPLPPFPADFRLFLASASPRRRELLAAAGLPFEVVSTEAEEASGGMEPSRLAEENALRKARSAHTPDDTSAGVFVLGADTLVVVGGGLILGKPSGPLEARAMLESLSGMEHEVVTGVALVRTTRGGSRAAAEGGECHLGSAATVVRMRALNLAEVDAYIASEEWRDKAGGYAVQGLAALVVDGVEGDYSNVVGLPLSLVGSLLRDAGFDPVARRWSHG